MLPQKKIIFMGFGGYFLKKEILPWEYEINLSFSDLASNFQIVLFSALEAF